MPTTLDFNSLRAAVQSSAAAFRAITEHQPAGGPGDKVFPPTYAGGKYATEGRFDPDTGAVRKCVVLDSVQSQANRMELALLEAHRAGKVSLPLLVVRFDQDELLKKFTVTSLEAPHRVADALFRDCLLRGRMFRESPKGRILDLADVRSATGMFGLCPTGLVFGLWDSTGPRGGLGAKFQRALVSEIVGYDAVKGVNTASRIDPAQIMRDAGPLYLRRGQKRDSPAWTLDKGKARQKGRNAIRIGRGSDMGRPSQANLGNVTPNFAFARDSRKQIIKDVRVDADGQERTEPRILGGFTISKAVQTTVLSLSAVRRLRFPIGEAAESKADTDVLARTVVAALGLAAGTLARVDTDLRSRCHLLPTEALVWELLDCPDRPAIRFALESDQALALLRQAILAAKEAGLPWDGEIELNPSPDLVTLVRRSQELAADPGGSDSH